ncbi:HAD-like protein [Wallemia mellicola]|uniref:HAD-like protein n=1 Tax=Wallemia mellicola TaxID=1708541 RepID=A0A4T0NL21_9BASI|nr:HAD-like protein [Wallemia mellicola]TIB97805.1 HAD-like protein [Wallemia mellicola]TIC11922.1 HAD-like protein [Wallemia mellicola]TIC31065.1 HAD-like protein [Wallemia mellicola]
MSHNKLPGVKVLIFDTFGTTVNWRYTVLRELKRKASEHAQREVLMKVDWSGFLEDWRNKYKEGTKRHSEYVAESLETFVDVDRIHREALDNLTEKYAISGLYTTAELDELNRVWHRLEAWPDSSHGLKQLRERGYKIGTLSGATTHALHSMSAYADLPWDFAYGSDIPLTYKPNPVAYRECAKRIGVKPEECAMVAAHTGDCQAAMRTGMRSVYVERLWEDEPVNSASFDIYVNGVTEIDDIEPSSRQIGFVELANVLSN